MVPSVAAEARSVERNGGGDHVAVSDMGPVDVSNWSFYARPHQTGAARPTPYLVGPIVGTVTETDARVLVEVARTQPVTMEAFMDGARVYSHTAEVRARTPTAFKLRNFAPNKRVRVTVNVGEFGQEREARFKTPSNKMDWKIAAVSCNSHTKMERLGLWDRLARVVDDVDCVLHLGDQVYADTDLTARNDPTIRFDSAWTASLGLMHHLSPDDWASKRNEMLEHYRKTYRTTWNLPACAIVLASTANYMICDDHEVVDDLGDEPEHLNPDSAESFVIKVAYQVYCEYQKQLLCDTDVTDSTTKPYYALRLSPKIGFFMTDNRVERSIHRSQGREEDWKERDFLGPDQWARLNQALEDDFQDCETVIFGAPTPLVFISQKATGIAERVIDDARGTWGHEQFRAEQRHLCGTLSNWQSARPNRAVVTLAGDVHIGGFTDSWHNDHQVPLHQMTASAIGNLPEGNIDWIKSTLARQVLHADQHLFEFKVKHHDWIFGPNFGMVDVTVGKGGDQRPDISLTLVPSKGEPNVRNLALGDSNVPIHDAGAHGAAAVAHATAKVLAPPPPPPMGMGKARGSGGCCTCA